jgi:hypothetical protein
MAWSEMNTGSARDFTSESRRNRNLGDGEVVDGGVGKGWWDK